jgi:GNAT superfamily N-acetyltransferase
VSDVSDAQARSLADLLVDAVDGNASASFMHPLATDDALAFWRGVADGVTRGDRALLLAEDEAGVVGTVQLVFAQPPNQPHRADVAKLLVHRRARRRGLGEALMRAVDDVARACGRTVLVLDTETGGDAERLYARLGWHRCGVIPNYALRAHGGLCDTTVFSREPAVG